MNDKYTDLGKKLRIFRKNRLVLTQEELAQKLRVKQENISKSENGLINPDNIIEKIANLLKIDKSEIEDIDIQKAFNVYGNIDNSNLINTVNTINYNYNDSKTLENVKKTLEDIVNSLDKILTKDIPK
jgi:predicted transcriptional regulator